MNLRFWKKSPYSSFYKFQDNKEIGDQDALHQGFIMGGLPAYDMLGFAQYRYWDPIRELQPAQLWAHIAVPVAGVGGLVAGQIVGQPLVGPTNTSNPL